jgi:hypothetical protein
MALPRQHRHAYAAGIQRGLLTVGTRRLRSRGRRHTLSPPPRALHTGPISTRFEPVSLLRGFHHRFTLVTPSDLAQRTRAVWQCQHVPHLSGPLATLPGVPRIRLAHSSRAKKLEAAKRISLARLSSLTSRSSSLTRETSTVETPGRCQPG